MDDKNARLESELIAARRSEDLSGSVVRLGEPDDEDTAGDARTRQIRAEIEETRGEMSETVNAIQERLRPGHIASNAADSVREKASDAVASLREAAANAAGTVRGVAANAAGTARDAAATAVDTVRGAASSAAGTVRDGAASAAGAVREAAGTAAGNAYAVAGDQASALADSEPARYLRANPVQSIMLAAGIGGLTWLLCGPRRKSRGARHRPVPIRRQGPGSSNNEPSGLGNSRVQYDAGAEYGRLGSSEARKMATSGSRGTDEWGGTEDWAPAPAGADGQARRSEDDAQQPPGSAARRARPQLPRGGSGHPVLIGTMAAIIGAVAGAAILECVRENEWLGEAEDAIEPYSQPAAWQTPGGVGGVV